MAESRGSLYFSSILVTAAKSNALSKSLSALPKLNSQVYAFKAKDCKSLRKSVIFSPGCWTLLASFPWKTTGLS